MAKWRTSLNVFIDKLVFVMGSAPDQFPIEDYLPPDKQPNLENSYEKMRQLFRIFVDAFGETADTARWQKTIDESYELFKKGEKLEGKRRLNDLYNELEYEKKPIKRFARNSLDKET